LQVNDKEQNLKSMGLNNQKRVPFFFTYKQLAMDKKVVFSNLQYYGQVINEEMVKRQNKFRKICPKKQTLVFEPVDTFLSILDPSKV